MHTHLRYTKRLCHRRGISDRTRSLREHDYIRSGRGSVELEFHYRRRAQTGYRDSLSTGAWVDTGTRHRITLYLLPVRFGCSTLGYDVFGRSHWLADSDYLFRTRQAADSPVDSAKLPLRSVRMRNLCGPRPACDCYTVRAASLARAVCADDDRLTSHYRRALARSDAPRDASQSDRTPRSDRYGSPADEQGYADALCNVRVSNLRNSHFTLVERSRARIADQDRRSRPDSTFDVAKSLR